MSSEKVSREALRSMLRAWNDSGDWWLFALASREAYERAVTLITEFCPKEEDPVHTVVMENLVACRMVLVIHKGRLSPPQLARWFGTPERDEELIPVTILALGRGRNDTMAMAAAIELKGWVDGDLKY